MIGSIPNSVKLNEADRPAEKVLGLPARSRFGEGRPKPLVDLIRTSKSLDMKTVFDIKCI
jgi:hypothetical protein